MVVWASRRAKGNGCRSQRGAATCIPSPGFSALFHGTQQFIGPPRDGFRQQAVPLGEIV